MFPHPDGIARRIRWKEHDDGAPDWSSVAMQAAQCIEEQPVDRIREALVKLSARLADVPELLADHAVRHEIRNRLEAGIRANVARLDACGDGNVSDVNNG
jgi:serine/threonine-protein kinase HipA